jgi:hypothetical protein
MTCQICYIVFNSIVGVYNMSMLGIFIYVAKLINNVAEITDNSPDEDKKYYNFLNDNYRYYIIAECMYSFGLAILSGMLVYLLVKSYELDHRIMYDGYRMIHDERVENSANKDDVKFPLVSQSRNQNSNTNSGNDINSNRNSNRNSTCFRQCETKYSTGVYLLFIIHIVFLIMEAIATVGYCSFNTHENIEFRDYLLDVSRATVLQFDIKFGIAFLKLIGTFIAIPTILICNRS